MFGGLSDENLIKTKQKYCLSTLHIPQVRFNFGSYFLDQMKKYKKMFNITSSLKIFIFQIKKIQFSIFSLPFLILEYEKRLVRNWIWLTWTNFRLKKLTLGCSYITSHRLGVRGGGAQVWHVITGKGAAYDVLQCQEGSLKDLDIVAKFKQEKHK